MSELTDLERVCSPELYLWLMKANATDLPWEPVEADNVERWVASAGEYVFLRIDCGYDTVFKKTYKHFKLCERESGGLFEELESGEIDCYGSVSLEFLEALDVFRSKVVYRQAKDSNLPLLANLPDDLRAVAVEFLDLHGAWDTEFEAEVYTCEDVEPNLFVKWGSMQHDELGAVFSFFPAVLQNPVVNTWSLEAGSLKELHAKQSSSGPLRRSADFAEFIRRFAR